MSRRPPNQVVHFSLLGVFSCLFMADAQGAPIRWLLADPASLVQRSSGFTSAQTTTDAWTAVIAEPADPGIVLGPVMLSAGRERLLYLDMEVSAPASLQLFFAAAGQGFDEAHSVHFKSRLRGAHRHLYELDLRDVAPWQGEIRELRIDVDQAHAGDIVRLYRVGVGDAPITSPPEPALVRLAPRLPPRPGEPIPQERLAAWHRTVVVTDETLPRSAVWTYIHNQFTYTENNWLAAITPRVVVAGQPLPVTAAEDLKVQDAPGSVIATFRIGQTRLRTEITPLLSGRGVADPEGIALYTLRSDPPTPLQVEITSGKSLTLISGSEAAGLRHEELPAIEGGVQIENDVAQYRGGSEKVPVAIRTSGAWGPAGKPLLTASFPTGEGRVVLAFAASPERAAALTKLDSQRAFEQVGSYYEQLWATNHIDTPEPVMNEAFRHALRTMEYTWIEPIGWLECLHHWYSMWHMQATAGAEWIGQLDRSRACTVTHAQRLNVEGAVPQLSPSGHVHRDFGGSNQYWAWQVRHYWGFTGEIPFAREMAPALDKVLDQTFREYDKDNNLLLAWNLQIGNQEDYVATPYDGTTPAIEGINMMHTRAELARALGDQTTATLRETRAGRARSLLRQKLWMPDLGRFAYFVDPQGNRRLDGQYHTLTYPVTWGLVDPLDAYTMLRQVCDRLTGSQGEVYCSNNFPNHDVGTWGMQTGVAQQPWAAWAFSTAGQFERTWQPLRAAAKWAMDANKRGAWPEVSTEPTPAYFSPPAGLYVASVVEALFGLKVDAPGGTLTVAPSFPSAWPSASLKLAEFSARFE